MIVKSLIRQHMELKPIDVEIVLTPGLPTISILGLPDKIIQESTKRIQTALLNQGFQLPKARQVIVNLWPRDHKKSSLGLDLAIAIGILHESGQKVFSETEQVVYGELDMNGFVRAPEDLHLFEGKEQKILTGEGDQSYDFDVEVLKELKDTASTQKRKTKEAKTLRPSFLYSEYPVAAARLLKIVAAGEHSLVLVGPPGTGKTTFVESVISFLNPPSLAQLHELKKSAIYYREKINWRPVIKPHHSSTPLSLVGGGSGLLPGEIVRAHHGILILDELLEFSNEVQSMLREPMESGRIRLARAGRQQDFSCQALVLATSNLCPCGEYVPSSFKNCRCSSLQLRRYLQKLSGPFVDRFSIFHFTNRWISSTAKEETESSEEILKQIEKAVFFRSHERGQQTSNNTLSFEEVYKDFESENVRNLVPSFQSKRRELSFLRVARTIADLSSSKKINIEHVRHSLDFTFFPFEEIKKSF